MGMDVDLKKILIVSEQITPCSLIGAKRWTKITKFINQKFGTYSVDVFTLKWEGKLSRTDDLLKIDQQYVDRFFYWRRPALLWLRIYAWMNCKEHINPAHQNAESERTWRSAILSFENWVESFCRKAAIRKLNLSQYNVVITSYGPYWPIRLGEYIKKQNPSILWVADFRDQWIRDFDAVSDKKQKHKRALNSTRLADLYFRVNPHLDLINTHGKPVYTIPNGFDPDEAEAPIRADRFIISYTGTLHSTDDLSPLFHALLEIRDMGKVDFTDFLLVYAGRNSADFTKYITEAGLSNFYVDYGFIDRSESLKLQAKSSILVMAGWTTESDVVEWSGKMYEYMIAHKPIVYLMSGTVPNTMPSREMPRLGGMCYESCRHEETYPELVDYILKQYRQWKEKGEVHVEQDMEYINQYSYKTIADQVVSILEDHLADREGGKP